MAGNHIETKLAIGLVELQAYYVHVYVQKQAYSSLLKHHQQHSYRNNTLNSSNHRNKYQYSVQCIINIHKCYLVYALCICSRSQGTHQDSKAKLPPHSAANQPVPIYYPTYILLYAYTRLYPRLLAKPITNSKTRGAQYIEQYWYWRFKFR